VVLTVKGPGGVKSVTTDTTSRTGATGCSLYGTYVYFRADDAASRINGQSVVGLGSIFFSVCLGLAPLRLPALEDALACCLICVFTWRVTAWQILRRDSSVAYLMNSAIQLSTMPQFGRMTGVKHSATCGKYQEPRRLTFKVKGRAACAV
jgi:hypothetical protein